MTAGLTLMLVVALAYLATHVVSDWVARRFLIVSGAEYLVLGILLGPQFANVLDGPALSSFAPVIALAVGWMGASVGVRLSVRSGINVPIRVYHLAVAQALITLLFVTGLELIALKLVFGHDWRVVLLPALALGAVATVSTPVAAAVVAHRTGRGPVVRLLEVSALTDAVVGIVTIGVVLCIARPLTFGVTRQLTTTEWMAISLGIGVIGGALFHLFVGSETKVDRLVISLAGSLVLASGAAAYLELSPLLVAMVVAAMLVNTSGNAAEVTAAIDRGQRPLYYVLLVFAGASWQPASVSWLLPVALYLTARIAAKIGGARVSSRVANELSMTGAGWGWALIGQGGIALAVGLDYLRHGNALYPNLVFTAAVVSVLLTDLLSARVAHAVIAQQVGRADEEEAAVHA